MEQTFHFVDNGGTDEVQNICFISRELTSFDQQQEFAVPLRRRCLRLASDIRYNYALLKKRGSPVSFRRRCSTLARGKREPLHVDTRCWILNYGEETGTLFVQSSVNPICRKFRGIDRLFWVEERHRTVRGERCLAERRITIFENFSRGYGTFNINYLGVCWKCVFLESLENFCENVW